MAKDDYFKIVFIILTELYEAMKQGKRVVFFNISPQRFQIPEGYLMEIFIELLSEGYVKGFLIRDTKTGHCVAGLDEITITMKGIEYLQDNSKMKQVYNTLKEIRDWVPGI